MLEFYDLSIIFDKVWAGIHYIRKCYGTVVGIDTAKDTLRVTTQVGVHQLMYIYGTMVVLKPYNCTTFFQQVHFHMQDPWYCFYCTNCPLNLCAVV
jgi:hypothetical protein